MLHKMLRSKIHRATVTRCDPDYVGSITIDADLLAACGMRPNECVLVVDIDNGARFETYVILGESGSGEIGINGAAARLVSPGDKVIILAFGYLETAQLDAHVSDVVIATDDNAPGERLKYASQIGAEPISAE